MPSTLYTLARDLLADETKALLDEFIEWLSSDSDVAFPWHETGRRLADNLMSEAHLVGSGDYGSPQEMLQFLTTCVERFKLASTDQECRIAFNVACKEFFLRGLVIGTEILPDNLVRYGSERFLSIALRRMVGDRAADDFDRGLTPALMAEKIIEDAWNANKFLPGDRLALGEAAFATPFDEAFSSTSDARHIAESLALSVAFPRGKTKQRYLVQMHYPTDKVKNHRFPTVADAGNFPGFLPAPEIEPNPSKPETCVGWTCPIGSGIRRPEIVHANESLKILGTSLRLVGEI